MKLQYQQKLLKNPNWSRDLYRKTRKRQICYQTKYYKRRVRKDPVFRLSCNFSREVRSALKEKKGGRSWEKCVGYTLKDLTKHLESRFNDKMNWDNYGSYWHIDHIKPQCLFSYTSVTDDSFRECWSLCNLQPLEAVENLRKGGRWVEDSK